jgi:hypothetical protein
MPRNDAVFPRRQLALDHMKIGPADTASIDLHPDLPRAGFGNRHVTQVERILLDRSGMFDYEGFHLLQG